MQGDPRPGGEAERLLLREGAGRGRARPPSGDPAQLGVSWGTARGVVVLRHYPVLGVLLHLGEGVRPHLACVSAARTRQSNAMHGRSVAKAR